MGRNRKKANRERQQWETGTQRHRESKAPTENNRAHSRSSELKVQKKMGERH